VSWTSWRSDGWEGIWRPDAGVDLEAVLALVASGDGRTSRHARSVACPTPAGVVWVKTWPAPGARRARRAFAMHRALAKAGFAAPEPLVFGTRARAGLLVTADVGGEELIAAIVRRGEAAGRRAKRALLARLGQEVARLHRAGFVHGDLVPPNLRVRGDDFVFLDNDRTRRLPFAFGARRNLVQLGRFVVPGLSLTDRVRVLRAYAATRGFGEARRRRLAHWVARKVTQRRCAIDHIRPADAARAGFRELMRSGGPFDPGRAAA
jgi:hypothetical protein